MGFTRDIDDPIILKKESLILVFQKSRTNHLLWQAAIPYAQFRRFVVTTLFDEVMSHTFLMVYPTYRGSPVNGSDRSLWRQWPKCQAGKWHAWKPASLIRATTKPRAFPLAAAQTLLQNQRRRIPCNASIKPVSDCRGIRQAWSK